MTSLFCENKMFDEATFSAPVCHSNMRCYPAETAKESDFNKKKAK